MAKITIAKLNEIVSAGNNSASNTRMSGQARDPSVQAYLQLQIRANLLRELDAVGINDSVLDLSGEDPRAVALAKMTAAEAGASTIALSGTIEAAGTIAAAT